MPEAFQIDANRKIPDSLDFFKLRKKGIEHIAELAGDLWTDHNVHDPGITMLEVLCYALTDLGYRTQFKIDELLARPLTAIRNETPDNNFFTPAKILTCNPLTILDYRKLLIDVDGVRNAWLEPASEAEVQLYVDCQNSVLSTDTEGDTTKLPLSLNGLYNVLLELEPIRPADRALDNCGEEDSIGRILREVRARLHAHRNLGEDFLHITVLKEEPVGICADIELEPNANPDETLASILETVQLFFSPRLNYYTLQELLAKQKSMDDIFAGRPLTPYSHGFVDNKELEELQRWKEIRVSDIYREIMKKVNGVRGIKNLALRVDRGIEDSTVEEWRLPLRDLRSPVVSLVNSNIRFFKGVLPFEANENQAELLYRERLSNYRKVKLAKEKLDRAIPNGRYREDLGAYYSVQHDFPIVYGVGEDGVSDSAPEERKAQALQMKGYLLFYDQLLSSYLAQLANVRAIFSMHPDRKRLDIENQTYFTGDLNSVPELEKLIRNHEKADSDFRSKMILAEQQSILYHSPDKRDAAVEMWVKAFETDQIEVEVIEIEDRYYFEYHNALTHTMLRSAESYETEQTASALANSLRFLGTQAQAYRAINQQLKGEYSFDFIYNPLDYAKFADQLLESSKKYHARRNAFLDHLLARFSEQFTDYVLLTFALEGKNNDPKTIIEDKTHFLQSYPEISRNRGKAFDYTQEKVWNTDNISGLERRVTHLMGSHDWQRTSMGNFVLLDKKDELFGYALHDRCECTAATEAEHSEEDQASSKEHIARQRSPLLQNLHFYPTGTAEEAFNEMLSFAKQVECYKKYDCPIENAYGFQIVNEHGLPVAEHPVQYTTSDQRDDILRCIQNWLDGEPWLDGERNYKNLRTGFDEGWMTNIRSSAEGYYFWLEDEDGNELFRSATVYSTADEAWQGWLKFIDLARNFDNYTDLADMYDRYYFVIKQEENVLAIHPEKYKTKSERDEVKQEVFEHISSRVINRKVEPLPQFYRWQWLDKHGKPILESAHQFYTREQAASAFYFALEGGFFENEDSDDDKFSFCLKKNEAVILACSKEFESAADRDAAKRALQGFPQQAIEQSEKAFIYYLKQDGSNKNLLQSNVYFKTEDSAFHEAKHYLPLACKGGYLRIELLDDHCRWQVNLYNAAEDGCIVATSEHFISLEAANQRKAEIETAAGHLEKNLRVDQLDYSGYYFEIRVEEKIIIEGSQVYEKVSQALYAYILASEQAANAANYFYRETNKTGCYVLLDACQRELGRLETYSPATAAAKIKAFPFPITIADQQQKYHFQVLQEQSDKIWLDSTKRFDEKWQAEREFYQLVALVLEKNEQGEPKYIVKTKEEDGCRFGFSIEKEGQLEASHPTLYESERERNTAIQKMLDYLEREQLRFRVESVIGKYHAELWWLNCAGVCELLLKGDKQDTLEAAKYDLEKLRNYVCSAKSCKDIFKETSNGEEKKFSFKIDTPDFKFHHPKEYDSEATRDKVIHGAQEYICAYLKFQEEKEKEDKSYYILQNPCLVEDPCAKEAAEEKVAYRSFQLKKEDSSIAQFTRKYTDQSERDTAIEEMLALMQQERLRFSDVRIETKKSEEEETKYVYQIAATSSKMILWRSIESFDTAEAARQKAEAKHYFFNLLDLSRNASNYKDVSLNEAGTYQLHLLDENKEAVLKLPESLHSSEAVNLAKQKRRTFARQYPIVKRNKKWAFRLMDEKQQSILWKSTITYDSITATWADFLHFWSLLDYEGHYIRLDDSKARLFQIELGEVLLEGKKIYEAKIAIEEDEDSELTPQEEADLRAEKYTWTALGDFLERVQTKGAVQHITRYAEDCTYSFQFVGEQFWQAAYPRQFYSTLEAVKVRDWLFEKVNCATRLYSTASCKLCKVGDYYHYLISSDEQVLWRSAERFPIFAETDDDHKDLQEKVKAAFIDGHLKILHYAKFSSSYRTVSRRYRKPGEKTESFYHILQVLDEAGNVLAEAVKKDENTGKTVLYRFYEESLEELQQALDERLQHARLYPFFKAGDKAYGFQLFNEKEATLSIPTESKQEGARTLTIEPGIIFRSTSRYKTFAEAERQFGSQSKDVSENEENTRPPFLEVLQRKSNYYIEGDDYCGPFSIEIGHPDEVYATHPNSYSSKEERNRAIDKTTKCMNLEGFHVIEHILLRPEQASSEESEEEKLFPICVDTACCEKINPAEEDVYKSYLPGADPYSFWTTIVLPYWSRRFQKTAFRSFFEGTLRREIPAHMALSIAWISPEQMRAFERVYKNWLEALNDSGKCEYLRAKNEMITILNELENVYPPIRLSEGTIDEETTPTILDFSILR